MISPVKFIFSVLLIFLSVNFCFAGGVWLCSKDSAAISDITFYDENVSNFMIADMGNFSGVISISLRDIIDIYSGIPVRLGSRDLSACYITGSHDWSDGFLKELGLNINLIKSLSKKNALVQSRLYGVVNKEEVANCIESHFPAVGYAIEFTSSESVGKCF